MRTKLVWLAVAFLLLDVILAGILFLSRKQKKFPVDSPVTLSLSPVATSPPKRLKKVEISFESAVDGFEIQVKDKKALENVLSEVKFWQAWVAVPKVQIAVDNVAKVKVVLTDERQVEWFQEVQALQNPDGEVYQATGIALEGEDTLIFYIFLAPKFYKTESQERLTLRFLSQFLRTAASFGLQGPEYEEFRRSRRLGKILLERWKGRLPVQVVVSSQQGR